MKHVYLFFLAVAVLALVPQSAFLSITSVVPAVSQALSSISDRRVEKASYRTSNVERGDLTATVTAAGTLNAVVLVEVGSQISGQVQDLFADFNSAVSQGQIIARIDPEMYESKVAQNQAELEVAQAMVPVQQAQIERNHADLENAKAALAAAKAQTTRAEVTLDDAKRDLDRKQPLAERLIVSASDFERVQSSYRSAQAQLIAARAQELSQVSAIRASEAALRMAEAQVINVAAQVKQRLATLRQAQIELERTYIRAPVTGTVVNRNVNRGQTVAASLQAPTLFTLAQDLTQMQVEAAVVEADVSRFVINQPVTFTVDAHPGRVFTGSVKEIRKAPQIVQNVVTYTVVISAENPDGVLLPGMTANLQVVVAEKTGVLKVSNAALRFRPIRQERPLTTRGGAVAKIAQGISDPKGVASTVFVVGPEGEPRPVPVWLGITDGRATELVAGELGEGDEVIAGTASTGSAHTAAPVATFRLR